MSTPVLLLGKFAPPFLAFARSAAVHGHPPHMLDITDGDAAWRDYSSVFAGGMAIAPGALGTEAGLETIAAYAARIGAGSIIALTDAHLFWLARHRDRFEPRCRVLIPPIERLLALTSKVSQVELARSAGFQVLPSWTLGAAADAALVPDEAFPLVLRPGEDDAVTPMFKVEVLTDRAALEAFVAGRRFLRGGIIAQPFRALPNLLVHGARSEAGEILSMEAFLVARKFEGVALSVQRTRLPTAVDAACRAFAELAQLTGVFHFDLLGSVESGQAYYLEINARLGGTTDKVLRLGYDEPALALRAFGLPIVRPDALTAHVSAPTANKRMLLKHITHAVRGRLTPLDYPATGPLGHVARSLWDLARARDSVFDWSDLRGSLRFHLRR